MNKNVKKGVAIVAMFLLAVTGLGLTQSQSQALGQPQRMIITFDSPANENARAALQNLGGKTLMELPLVNGISVLLPDHAAARMAEHVPGVASVEVDAIVKAFAPPLKCSPWPSCKNSGGEEPPVEPPVEPSQIIDWGVARMNAPAYWSIASGQGVNVAIIDTGIDQDHVDLVDNIKGGINFVSKSVRKRADSTKWNDDNGHGTHVAGSVAAVNNLIGVVGVAPNANLYGVKVLSRDGSGYTSWVIAGIEWAVANNIDVINMSLGSSTDTQALHDAVDAADAAGVIVVAAAGNEGDGDPSTNEVGYPGKYSSVIAVAATSSNDLSPSWSSEGQEVFISAPGASILSTWFDGGYNTISGTSMATPHIAGAIAVMLSENSGWGLAEVKASLITNSEDLGLVGFDNHFGNGLMSF